MIRVITHYKRVTYGSGEFYAMCGATPKVGKAADKLALDYDLAKVTCKRCLRRMNP